MNSNKRILRSKQTEISKAGRLLFDAIFSDGDDFQRQIGDELDAEEGAGAAPVAGGAPAQPAAVEAIPVDGRSFVRCERCGREVAVAPTEDALNLERHGWRFAAGVWRCSFCRSR
jgi:hypothetical protein